MSYVRMLNSGNEIDLKNPESGEFDINDIAWGLSRINRWAGQSFHRYSVARHSLDVVQRVYVRGDAWSTCVAMFALFHDAEEAFTGDVIAPVRDLVPEFNQPAKRIRRAIQNRLMPVKALQSKYCNPDTNSIVIGADLFQRQMEDRVLRVIGAEYPDRERGVSYSDTGIDQQDFLDTYGRLCIEIERLA